MELGQKMLKAIRGAHPGSKPTVAASSQTREDGVSYALVELDGVELLCVSGAAGSARGFGTAEEIRASGGVVSLCHLNHENASELRRRLAFTAPSTLGKTDITIGVGDRLGMAGRGHIRAFRGYKANPVLAQQSVRELTLTSRSFAEVLDSSTWAVFAEGFRAPWGADGDHLKAVEKVAEALAAGFTMITADVSDHLHTRFLAAGDAEAEAAYSALDAAYRKDVEDRYLSRPFQAAGSQVSFTRPVLMKTVLAYRDSLDHAAALYRAGTSVARAGGFDFELSIDETDSPTSPQAHVFMALEARRKGVTVTSIAPRFVGEFQKGIDYIGSVKDFEAGFAVHAGIAETLGHRISVHSGSDKFSVFPAVGRLSRGRFHLKTAGTSWLEALRVISSADLPLFRDLYNRALERYQAARAYYHVTPDLSRLPASAEMLDEKSAPALLEDADARRLLHITYGEMLAVPELKKRFFGVLSAKAEAYRTGLQSHIGRHLQTLGVPKNR